MVPSFPRLVLTIHLSPCAPLPAGKPVPGWYPLPVTQSWSLQKKKTVATKLADKKTHTKLILSNRERAASSGEAVTQRWAFRCLIWSHFETKWNLFQFQIFYLFLFKHGKK